ncbi:helix-turn-helix domain-containing protein [Brachybacterium huguangmaarense]
MDDGLDPLLRELVGGALREERTRQSRTLADVAASAGVSMQHLSDIERGRKDPSSEVLAAITGALGLTLPELLRASARSARPVVLDLTARRPGPSSRPGSRRGSERLSASLCAAA